MKKLGEDAYIKFKKREKQFWIIEPELISLLEEIQVKTVGDKKRRSGELHAGHMKNVAYRTLALGGSREEFITAYIHDCMEEANDTDKAESVIRSSLVPMFGEEYAGDIVERIKILTEDSFNSEAIARYGQIAGKRIAELCTLHEIPYTEKNLNYAVKYSLVYSSFQDKLLNNIERIRNVETADRWDALSSMEYLADAPLIIKVLSFSRLYIILKVMRAHQFIFDLFDEKAEEFGVKLLLVSAFSQLFMMDVRDMKKL